MVIRIVGDTLVLAKVEGIDISWNSLILLIRTSNLPLTDLKVFVKQTYINFEHISHFFLVFLLLALSKQIPAELYVKWPVYGEFNDGKTKYSGIDQVKLVEDLKHL